MLTAIIAVICFISLAFVASPFIAGRQEWRGAAPDKKMEQMNTQKEIYYQAIKDVDFEHAEGKLTEKDYHELRDYYKEKAIQTVKKIDSLEKNSLQASAAQQEEDEDKSTGEG